MTRHRKRSRAKTPPPAEGGRISRRAQVWLATLGTVVGVATGMVALAKEVAPNRSSTAQASMPQFQQSVGSICEDVDRHDADRIRDTEALRRRLKRARRPLEVRDALLESYQRTLRNAEHDEATLAALATPQSLVAARRATTRAWTDNLERIRAVVHGLDGAGTWAELDAVVEDVSSARTRIDRGVSTVRTGLLRLGGGQCRLEAQRVSRPVVLPPRPRSSQPAHRPVDPSPTSRAPVQPVDPPAEPAPAPAEPPAPTAPAPSSVQPPAQASPPAPTAPPSSVQPPGPGAGGGGG